MGLELLLARSQLWQETAARHVRLDDQLAPLAALAARWHQLELASWRLMLQRVVQREADGAHSAWFHLAALLLPACEAPPTDSEQQVSCLLGARLIGHLG